MKAMMEVDFTTVFFHGWMASRSQTRIFTNEAFDIVSAHNSCEVVESFQEKPYKPPLLRNIFSQPELPCHSWREVAWREFATSPICWTKKVLSHCALPSFKNERNETLVSNMSLGSIAGVLDVEESLKNIKRAASTHKKIVLAGYSRGASTTLISASQLPKEIIDKVAFILVFSPFDSLETFCYDRVGWWHHWIYGPSLPYVLPLITGDSRQGVSPLDAVDKISWSIPIAFVYSADDNNVPPDSTERLLSKLNKHPNVTSLKLTSANHKQVMFGREVSKFVSALYSKYIYS